MTHRATVHALLAGLETSDAADWHRKSARIAWIKETCAAWHETLLNQMDRCSEAVDKLSEEDFQRLCDEEQAKVDAIRAKLDPVIEHDRWPREGDGSRRAMPHSQPIADR